MNRNNIADRFGPRVSNFLSSGIVVFIKIDDFRHFSILCLLFSQYWRQVPIPLSFRKKNSGSTTAGTASKIQYLNIIHISKNLKIFVKNCQLVFKPWLFAENRVSKIPVFVHGFSKNFPPHEFPTPWFWIFGEAALAADKNQEKTGRQGRISRLPGGKAGYPEAAG